jgi:hypothetical protein
MNLRDLDHRHLPRLMPLCRGVGVLESVNGRGRVFREEESIANLFAMFLTCFGRPRFRLRPQKESGIDIRVSWSPELQVSRRAYEY